MDTSDVEQTKLVVLTPIPNRQEKFKGENVRQFIKVIARNDVSNIPVERKLGKAEVCIVWGDPHVIQFDEVRDSSRMDRLRNIVKKNGFNQGNLRCPNRFSRE
jgi:hypothetical protein